MRQLRDREHRHHGRQAVSASAGGCRRRLRHPGGVEVSARLVRRLQRAENPAAHDAYGRDDLHRDQGRRDERTFEPYSRE